MTKCIHCGNEPTAGTLLPDGSRKYPLHKVINRSYDQACALPSSSKEWLELTTRIVKGYDNQIFCKVGKAPEFRIQEYVLKQMLQDIEDAAA